MMLELFSQLINSLLLIVDELGYIGIFIGMTVESSFFPFPSEIILIPAGANIAHGNMLFSGVFIASLLGSLVGAFVNYFLAFFLGRKTIDFLVRKYGRIFFISQNKLKSSENYFDKHGEITTFIGRLIPIIRQLISLPAGFSKMNFSRFTFFTALGSGIWAIILVALGYFLGTDSITSSQKLLLTLVLILLSIIIIGIYLLFKKMKNHSN